MNYKKTLEKFEKWINIIQKSILVLTGIEVLIVIIIGIASSNIYHEKYSDFWLSILIFLGILFLIITVIKFAYNKSFPASIMEELKAKNELEIAEKSIKRKDAINNYISSTIISLSNSSCNIPQLSKEDNLISFSDEDFSSELNDLTSTFNRILNVLLNTSNIHFSTGVYVDYFRAINHENSPEENKGTFLLRDDFELSKRGEIKNIMTDAKISGIGLEIQNAIKISFNNGKFCKHIIENKGNKKALIICSNIQDLKDSKNQEGVLFIITKFTENLPNDIESVLKMFTNIISHWLKLYDHEVIQRQIKLIGQDHEGTDKKKVNKE